MSAMDGIVRLFQEMDADMYEGWSEKRWRHFMPVQLAVESVRKSCVRQKLKPGQK
jgi:hypothetical protein